MMDLLALTMMPPSPGTNPAETTVARSAPCAPTPGTRIGNVPTAARIRASSGPNVAPATMPQLPAVFQPVATRSAT
jgi:hypothetical protein